MKQYLVVRESLLKEKADLEVRLAHINKALASGSGDESSRAVRNSRGISRRARNQMSLKDAITRVTSAKPLTKPEILEAIRKQGYRFATNNPMATLNSVLYAKRQFRNESGRFCPAGKSTKSPPALPARKRRA